MKTGRARKKDQPTPREPVSQEDKVETQAPASKPAPKPSRPRPSTTASPPGATGVTSKQSTPKKPKPPYLVFAIMGVISVCFVILAISMTLRGGSNKWVEATRVTGAWTAIVTVRGPQVQVEQMWEADCINNPNGTIRFGTCILRDSDTYQDRVVDDYEEYGYNIYYEETWSKVYQAQGIDFTVTTLGSDDWWEGNLHYKRQEELDKGSCQYTSYAIWVDDPQTPTQEIEVYLTECEVWDHVVVEERVYDQRQWCQCDVTSLVEIGQQSEQGTGLDIGWPVPNVPAGGSTERSFKGQVIFLGGDYVYTTTTDELDRYQDYLMSKYYIGLRDDKPVTVSKNPRK